MTALTVRPAVSEPDPLAALLDPPHRRRRDRAVTRVAFAAALVLHVLFVFVPLPQREAPAVVPEVRDAPVLTDWVIPPPPPPEPPPPAAPRAPAERLPTIPVPERPATLEPEPLEPVVEAPPEDWVPSDLPVVERAAPPPRPPKPDVYLEHASGLANPIACAGNVQPVYPEMGRIARREGSVILRAVVELDGSVADIEVLRAPRPDLGFSEAAIDAVSRWCYEPGRVGERAVRVQIAVHVDFVLN